MWQHHAKQEPNFDSLFGCGSAIFGADQSQLMNARLIPFDVARFCIRVFILGLLTVSPSLADCSLTNTGVKPLPEYGLGAYQGFPAGLYPNGANNRPPTHLAAALNIATNQIKPLDAAGNVNTNSGKIVLLSSGMSNTTQEWASKGTGNFEDVESADASRNPRVVIVDGAIGGQDAPQWTNINSANWQTVITQRLAQAGVTTNQVQVMWLKQAIANETGPLTNHAALLQNYLATIVRNAKILFPNLKLVYLSSRTRAYVAGAGLNPEPYAFETGFAVKWLIEDQINGDPNLNFDPAKGPVVAPLISWGPYLWVDGTVPRADNLTWLCSDLETDFTHPSATGGVPKVAHQLVAFFKTDPTATPWFLKKTATPPALSVTADMTNGVAPLTVDFSASFSGSVTQAVWTFDDGEFAFAQHPVKIFPTPGVYVTRVTVTDTNGAVATASVPITVNTTFNAWRTAKFTAQELTNAAISGLGANPDHDAFPNLLEYAMGLDPKASNSATVVQTLFSNGVFTLSFPHFKPAAEVSLTAEVSSNFVTWAPVPPVQTIDNGILETLVVQEIPAPGAARFFRLRASQ
jgi:PKD repeat protein